MLNRWNQPGLTWNQPGLRWNSSAPPGAQIRRKIMAKVRLAMDEMTDSEFLEFVKAHVQKITGNASFPTPTPAPADFAAGLTAFEAKLTAQIAADLAAKQATQEKNDARDALQELVRQRGEYVQTASGGKEAEILSAGFDVRAPRAPVGLPAMPTNLVATMSDLPGSIDVMWDRVRGASTYVVQICPDPLNEANWRQIGLPTKSAYTATGLNSGSRYWFRVAAIGAAGQGPWSDQAMKMAP
jgi:hypothetical protein